MRASALALLGTLVLVVPEKCAGGDGSRAVTSSLLRRSAEGRSAEGLLTHLRSSARPTQSLRGGSDLAQCKFEVKVAENLKPGDTLVLVRSGGDLPVTMQGAGESEAIEMWKDPGGGGWWLAEMAVPVGDTVRFKFAIRSRDGDVVAWEPGLDRKTTIPDQYEPVLTYNYGEASTPATAARKKRSAGLLGGVAIIFRIAYGRLPSLLASLSDAVGLACRRCPALFAHAPLALLLAWDLSRQHEQADGKVRVVVRKRRQQ